MLDTKFKKTALALSISTLALAASPSASAFVLVPNGDFETPGGASWGFDVGGGAAFAFPTTGGNGGGYLQMDNTSAVWGGVAVSTDDPAGSLLSTFGVTAGETYTFQWDQLCESGGCAGMGIKVESWNDAGFISTPGDQFFANTGAGWETQTYDYTIDASATRLKIVLLGIDAESVMGFDNVGIVGAQIPLPAAAWLFGSSLLGFFGFARRKKA